MIGNRLKTRAAALCLLAAAIVLIVGTVLVFHYGFGNRIKIKLVRFNESARQLDNPNRGFYYMYDFWITDEETDYEDIVADRFQYDTETNLSLLQICLQDYQNGGISEAGMKNIRALFKALETVDKQFIVRFVYDREGKNLLYEPQNLSTVLRHMEQVGSVLEEYRGQIFIVQGLFIGNWGEMHGSRYTEEEHEKENLRRLAKQLADVTDPSTYLAVRTPAQWRIIVQSYDSENGLKERMGLFNDGMLGNEYDYGTYGIGEEEEGVQYQKWNREDEMSFQEEICCLVPNGGEVITPNSYNDIERAIEGMATMHVTYLNGTYDNAVLKKWADTTVTEDGCFDGMDGLTYMERHLGYRLLIDKVDYDYRRGGNTLLLNIAMRNVGFAPIYREPIMKLKLYNENTGEITTMKAEGSLSGLVGGNHTELSQNICIDMDINGLSAGKYTMYLLLLDTASGKHIQLANEQEEEKYGYRLGELICR